MYTGLTPSTATDLGRSLKFLRRATGNTLADSSRHAGMSIGYLQNIEAGRKVNVEEEKLVALAGAFRIDPDVIRDLLLRARVMAALDSRGLDEDAQQFVWRGAEQRIREQGIQLRLDLGQVVSEILERR